ncbi:MAG: hypothetical protein H7301_09840 [Cryobacterium sp.]|nr:hypothetical protein [Oligoflexia bacterium]
MRSFSMNPRLLFVAAFFILVAASAGAEEKKADSAAPPLMSVTSASGLGQKAEPECTFTSDAVVKPEDFSGVPVAPVPAPGLKSDSAT